MGDALRRALDRPVLLVLFGTLGLLIAMAATGWGVWSLVQVASLGDLRPCDHDFSGRCLTERDALVEEQSWSGGRRMDTTPTWRLAIDGGLPSAEDTDRLYMEFRPQDDLGDLTQGIRVTVVFIDRDAAWLRLPSGATLESVEHPRYTWAPSFGVALMIAGPSLSAILTGVRGRRGGWAARTPSAGYGPDRWWLLSVVGLAGFVVQLAFPRPPARLVILGVLLLGGLIALGLWLVLPRRSSGRHAR
ncbi:hypothetical protein [Jiangella sp. DSM 45060]|uniref:hypothetical protein n=1 Tax=Jiangella sp. DSM 45060 TaxID=1798224 RepID=UPI00087D2AF9|nr:hypothetical protein [Jiangella sp. DSM 45060]SDT59087.1 hypothetical protein SAMN04515669_4966 [Jiangella sp. DSM 45060]